MSLTLAYSRCHRAPDCPPGCDCAAWERFQESDDYPAWQLEQLERDDELHPPQPGERPVTAWECTGSVSCRTLLDDPHDLCRGCEAIASDARTDAMLDAIEVGDFL